jgi:zinc transporter ZupT
MLPVATGFAAGSMMWVVLAELLPEALEEQKGVPAFLRNTLAACAVLTKRAGCTAACSS